MPYTSQNTKTISMQLTSKCSICPFQDGHKRTSEIQLAIFNWVDVGKGILDELDGQSHCGGRYSSGRCSSTGVSYAKIEIQSQVSQVAVRSSLKQTANTADGARNGNGDRIEASNDP